MGEVVHVTAINDYCGCCGYVAEKGRRIWCRKCAVHVLLTGPIGRRTFEAQHKKPCPFQQPAAQFEVKV